jgi:hypothetical protein
MPSKYISIPSLPLEICLVYLGFKNSKIKNMELKGFSCWYILKTDPTVLADISIWFIVNSARLGSFRFFHELS